VYTLEYQTEYHLFSLLYPEYTQGYQAEVDFCYILRIRKDIKRKLICSPAYVVVLWICVCV